MFTSPTSGAALAALLSAACVPADGPLMRPGEDCLECHGGGTVPGEAATVADRESARRWTVAGTVYATPDAPAGRGVRGAKVHLRDANGRAFTLVTNLAGNFYSAEPLVFPLEVTVEHAGQSASMEDPVEYGGCNGCHRQPPRQEAPGRVSAVPSEAGRGPLMRPGQDCLECHGDGPAPGEAATVPDRVAAVHRWTVAGTVYPTADAPEGPGVSGPTVRLVDATGKPLTLETNLAGNFYSAEPLVFPLAVTVEHAGQSASMGDPVPYGGCNGCHRQPPRQEAPGRISAVPSEAGRGPLMRPGQDCLECHGEGPVPGEAPTVPDRVAAVHRWTVAGTVYPSPDAPEGPGVVGATVLLVDATGKSLTLESNLAGNFYSTEPLVFPLEVTVEYAGQSATMEDPVPYGGCNGCHRQPPRQEAPGRVSAAGGGDEGALPP